MTGLQSTLGAGPLSQRQVTALGIDLLPDTVWAYRPDAPPCPARVVGYQAIDLHPGLAPDAAIHGATVVATLAGCEGTKGGWVALDHLPDCALVVTVPVAIKTDDNGFGRVPRGYRTLVPTGPCPSPCRTAPSIDELPTEPRLAQVSISKVSTRARNRCDWDTQTTYGQYRVLADDSFQPLDPPLGESLPLVGAFVHDRVPALLLYATGSGVWSAHAFLDNALGAGTQGVWYNDSRGCAQYECCCGC